jgi:hypothetical protein
MAMSDDSETAIYEVETEAGPFFLNIDPTADVARVTHPLFGLLWLKKENDKWIRVEDYSDLEARFQAEDQMRRSPPRVCLF